MHSKESKQEIAELYIKHLSDGKMKSITFLFSKDAIVLSPVYGEQKAVEFYKILGADTNTSVLTSKGFFDEADSNRFALFFNYEWEIADGNLVNFDVVDIFELDGHKKIKKLQIIYDASESSKMVQQLKKE